MLLWVIVWSARLATASFIWMVVWVLAAADPGTAEFEQDGVRIEVTIHSHIYEWKVTNLSASPITSFQVQQYHLYNQLAPDGWSLDAEGDHFRAGTDDVRHAIPPNRSAVFKARVSSAGAVLGRVTATVGIEGQPRPLKFDAIWGPVPEPIGKILVIPLTIAAMAALHFGLVSRRERSAAPHGSSAA